MNKICTSIEQSQKLIELGLDVNTADMYWLNRHIDLTETKYELFVVDRSNKHVDFFNSYAVAVDNNEIVPAWSLTGLLGLIPPRNILLRDAWFGKYKCINTVDSSYYDNPLDAAFEMVCLLKENGKI